MRPVRLIRFRYPHDHELAGLHDWCPLTHEPKGLRWVAILIAVALVTLFGAYLAAAQGLGDGGEFATGQPRGSLGRTRPVELGTAGTAPISVDVLPRIALAPASVRIRVTVERHADNRLLGVNLDGPAYGRYFEEQLDGVEAARTRQRIYDGLPGGIYIITACVRRVTGRPVCARPESFEVIGHDR